MAEDGFAAMPAAMSWARAHSCSRSTISVTKPISNAVVALTRSSLPISAMRNVWARPTLRMSPTGSRAETMPKVTWESKNVASGAQITMSDSLMKYSAPAVQMPCTAHTTGFHTCCHFGLSNSPGSSWFQMSSGCP